MSRQYSEVPFPDNSEPMQGEVCVHVLNESRLRRNQGGQTAGRDTDGVSAELVADAPHESFDHADVAPEQPGLDRANSRVSDDGVRLAHVDTRQPRGTLEQGVGRNLR